MTFAVVMTAVVMIVLGFLPLLLIMNTSGTLGLALATIAFNLLSIGSLVFSTFTYALFIPSVICWFLALIFALVARSTSQKRLHHRELMRVLQTQKQAA